jgi:hypothetical protein
LDGEVVNVTCCDSGVVEPIASEGAVQNVRLGVTEGGGVPVACMVPFSRLKLPGVVLPVNVKLIVPEVRLTVVGMDAGTAVIKFPLGTVAIAFTTASPATLQLAMARVPGPPAVSVNVTVTGGEDEAEQSKPATAIVTPL